MKRNQDLELENLSSEDAAWAGFLSGAVKLREVDETAAPKVLNALKLEREHDAAWAGFLSGGAVLRPVDYASVKPALIALKLERTRARKTGARLENRGKTSVARRRLACPAAFAPSQHVRAGG